MAHRYAGPKSTTDNMTYLAPKRGTYEHGKAWQHGRASDRTTQARKKLAQAVSVPWTDNTHRQPSVVVHSHRRG